jgi:hypothetical protein
MCSLIGLMHHCEHLIEVAVRCIRHGRGLSTKKTRERGEDEQSALEQLRTAVRKCGTDLNEIRRTMSCRNRGNARRSDRSTSCTGGKDRQPPSRVESKEGRQRNARFLKSWAGEKDKRQEAEQVQYEAGRDIAENRKAMTVAPSEKPRQTTRRRRRLAKRNGSYN